MKYIRHSKINKVLNWTAKRLMHIYMLYVFSDATVCSVLCATSYAFDLLHTFITIQSLLTTTLPSPFSSTLKTKIYIGTSRALEDAH